MCTRAIAIASTCLLLIVIVAGSASGTTLLPMSDRDLAMQADAIVIGTVLRVIPGPPIGPVGVTTDVQIRVDVPLKHSRPLDIITLTLPGRPAGGPGPWVEGTPTFRVGGEYLVYVDKMPDGRLDVLGWQQGAAAIRRGRLAGSGRRVTEAVAAIQDIVGRTATLAAVEPKGRSDGIHGTRTIKRMPAGVTPTFLGRGRESGLPGPDGTVALLREDFERGFPGYNGWGVLGGYGPYWDDVMYMVGPGVFRATSGYYSGYCVGSHIRPPGPYWDACASWMVAGPFDLSGVSEAHLRFYVWLDTELYHDTIFWGVGPETWDGVYDGFSVSGNSRGWVGVPSDPPFYEAPLTNYCGDDEVYIAFVFSSDWGTNREGVYLDDILLYTGNPDAPEITNISPPKASANTGTSVTITGTKFGSSEGDVCFPWGQEYYAADVTSWSSTSITCKVPTANSGGVYVLDSSGRLSDPYDYQIGFCYMGRKVADDSLPDPHYYHSAGTPDALNEFARLDSAMATWTSLTDSYPFGGYLGQTATLPYGLGPGGQPDSEQVMGWIESGWTSLGLPEGAIAVCVTWADATGLNIHHHDIAFNGEHFSWSDSGAAGKMDIQNIATHEMGHWWGLKDLYGSADSEKTMFGIADYAIVYQRTLEPDDIAGIQWMYPGKPSLDTTPSSLSFSMNQGGASPAAQTVTVCNSGSGHLSYTASAADPWVSVAPSAGNGATDMTVDVSVDVSGKAEGTYNSSVTITGPPGATNSPTTIPVQLVVSPSPALTLEWLGTPGYLADGCDPQQGTPKSTQFTFRVKITAPDGTPPSRMVVRLQRVEDARTWKTVRTRSLVAESGAWETGMVCQAQARLPNGAYQYCFIVCDAEGTRATGDPANWARGPTMIAPPQLWCTGLPGRQNDYLDPETGSGRQTRFRFSVQCTDSEADRPIPHRIQLQRKRPDGAWRGFCDEVMASWGGGLRMGKYYSYQRKLPAGEYRHRFVFADGDGPATGSASAGPDATQWQDGPVVSESAADRCVATTGRAAVVSSLAALPCPAGVQISFSLSSAAHVQARVINIAGRPVKTVCHARDCEAGTNTLVWDARSDAGLKVPAGTYLVEITSKTADGSASRAITTLRLGR